MSDNCNDKIGSNGRWTKEQHQKFLIGLHMFGKNWKKIQSVIGTRTGSQIRSHAQKFFLKVKKTLQPQQEEQRDSQELPSLSHSTCEQDKTLEVSYFFQQIINHSKRNQQFDFWLMLVDHPTNSSVTESSSVKRKSSFVQFDNSENSMLNELQMRKQITS